MRTRRSNSGFTLVETIAAIVVISVIGSLGSTLVARGVESMRGARASGQLHDDLSRTMDAIVRELRQLGRDSGGNTQLSWCSSTGVSYGSNQAIYWEDDQVKQDGGATTTYYMSGITDFTVRYFDQSNVELSPPMSGAATQAVHRIDISITAQSSYQGRNGARATETLRSRVFLRDKMRR